MDVKNLIMGVIALSLGAVMIAGALLPTIGAVTSSDTTFSNEDIGLYYMTELDNTSEYTLEWSTATPTQFIINEEIVSANNLIDTNLAYTVLCSFDDFLYRFAGTTNGNIWIQAVNTGGSLNLGTASYDYAKVTVNLSGGTLTQTVIIGDGTDPQIRTAEITKGYAIVPDGNGAFVMKNPNKKAYILSDTEIIGMGITQVGTQWKNIFTVSGTVDNMSVSPSYVASGGTMSISDIAVYSNEVKNYTGLYEIDYIEFTATDSTDNSSADVIYSYFLVPAEVTADKTYQIGAGEVALFNVLPIIAVAGLVLAGIYVFISRK